MSIGHSGLSGVRAATFDLSSIGNNVANAGTVGFKKSTTEFADVISGQVGGGVEVTDLRQIFKQGSVQATGNTWDLAISGRGFFKVSEGSDDPNVAVKDNFYTRNGAFGVDELGYVTSSAGMRLHIYEARGEGDNVEFPVSTNTTEILIEQSDSEAKTTSGMTGTFNLDARVSPRGSAYIAGSEGTGSADGKSLAVGSQFVINGKTVTVTGHAEAIGATAGTLDGTEAITLNGVTITTSGTQLSDLVNAINDSPNLALDGVTAQVSGLGQLKITADEGDLLIAGDVDVLTRLGLQSFASTTIPAVTLQTLANDINSVGAAVLASVLVSDNDTASDTTDDYNTLELSANTPITIQSGNTQALTGDPADLTRDILSWAGLSEGTQDVVFNGTVNPSQDNTYDHSVTYIVYDTLGSKQTMNTYFQKVTEGQWEVSVQRVDGLGNTYPVDEETTLKVGTVEFDGSGALRKMTSGQAGASTVVYDNSTVPVVNISTKLTFDSGNPSMGDNGMVSLDISGTNQFAGKFRIIDLGQDGYSSGALTGVDVDEDGIIRASYTNGNTKELGMIALFEFNNPQGLRQEGGVLWKETNDSGEARPGEPGESIYGRIKSQALESSAVDVTEELVSLITAQRNFQANSKMISASKEMNQVVLNI
ncbi:MAG: flagellar hook-basal body complex protein [Gammaproteobacteria bacterium]|nr:flagellar hook-basal body complex protein [Gammaproteobacteria bacterium]